MINAEIEVYIKNVYGNEKIYPNSILAAQLAKLAGHTTLTNADIKVIKAMGITIKVVPAPTVESQASALMNRD